VHVALRRAQVLVSGQLLDGSCRRPTRRQVRTERVPQDVNPRLHIRPSGGPPHQHLDDLLREWFSRSVAEHSRSRDAAPPAVPRSDASSTARTAIAHPSASSRARVLRRRRRQPFEIDFEIGVIDLDEIAALKRIGASLDLRAEGVELEAVSHRHVSAGGEWFSQVVRRQEGVDCLCLPA